MKLELIPTHPDLNPLLMLHLILSCSQSQLRLLYRSKVTSIGLYISLNLEILISRLAISLPLLARALFPLDPFPLPKAFKVIWSGTWEDLASRSSRVRLKRRLKASYIEVIHQLKAKAWIQELGRRLNFSFFLCFPFSFFGVILGFDFFFFQFRNFG